MEPAKACPVETFEVFESQSPLVPDWNQSGTRVEEDRNQPSNASISKNESGKPFYQGFEDFFQTGNPSSEDGNQTGTILEPALTLKEAVDFYKISEKTIRLHISQGKIPARKEQGPKGLEWRIYPSGVPAEPEPIESITEIELGDNQTGTGLEDTQNRAGTTVEPDWNQASERRPGELDKLLEVIQTQAQKLEAANYRIGYLEAQSQTYKEQIKLLTDSQHKAGWWVRFSSWFVGR